MLCVKINAATKTPHIYEDNNDLGELKKVTDKKCSIGYAYKLPENSLGRQYIKGNLAYEGFEIKPIAERKQGNGGWTKYLTDEEKQAMEHFKEMAMQRRAEKKQQKPTKEQKLKAQIEKYQKQLAALKASNNKEGK